MSVLEIMSRSSECWTASKALLAFAAFGISFIITKFDGLIRWSKLTLARQTADEFDEF